MPKHATMEQRLRWHLAHARACGCREIPGTVITALRARGIAIPVRAASRGRRTS